MNRADEFSLAVHCIDVTFPFTKDGVEEEALKRDTKNAK